MGVDELALAFALLPVADGVVFKDEAAVLLLAELVDWVELFKFWLVGVVAFGFWPPPPPAAEEEALEASLAGG